MQPILMHFFLRIGQRVLEKSRAYYYPLPENSEEEEGTLSNVAFAAMLKEIDAFSEGFRVAQTARDARKKKAG